MRLPGTDAWADDDVEAALAFADNLRVSTLLIGGVVAERSPPGGPIVESAWTPTDVFYELGDAAALAFATGRVSEGLRISGSLLTIDGPPPGLTLMQIVFGATLGAIAGTVDVQLFEDDVTISLGDGRGYLSLDLTAYPLAERVRLADLIFPAAFASPSFLTEVHGLQMGGFETDARAGLASVFTRLSPLNRFAQGWKAERRLDRSLLAGRLAEYEGYVSALAADEKAWGIMEFGGPLIDWPLLATLLGMHRAGQTGPETDPVLGPATRFLHDLARSISTSRPQP